MLRRVTFIALISAAGLLLAAPQADVPVTPDGPQDIDRHQLEIDDFSARHGPFDPQLAELLSARGLSLQHSGNHAGAIEAFKRALHINRVNHGLYSFQQEAVIRYLITSLNLLGAYEEVGHFHQQLTQLHNRQLANNPSEELVPLLLDSSDWHRDLHLELNASITVPYLRKSIRLARAAKNILSDRYHPQHQRLIEPLQRIAENSYYLTSYYQTEARFFGARGESLHQHLIEDSFNQGLESYQQIVAIRRAQPSSPQQLATAQIALGDYLQLFRKHDESHNAYISAWKTLSQAGDNDSIERLLGKPVKLPDFGSNITLGSKAVARVKAQIDSTGRASDVEILETWPADNQLVVQSAQRDARHMVFRNRVVDGKVASGTVEFNLLLN